jgi:hypothetical protein
MNATIARVLGAGREHRVAAVERAHSREAKQVNFPDLAWDHFYWERLRRTGEAEHPDAAARYRETRAAFEARYGEILGEYWSIREPSGVAVTRKHAPFLLRLAVDPRLRLHRATDWVTRDAPVVADTLFRCETLAIKVTEVLRQSSETIALRRIFAVASHLLGFLDRADGKPTKAECMPVVQAQRRELEAIHAYYKRAGTRIGRILYTWGMVIGLAFLAVLLAAFVVPLGLSGKLDWTQPGVQMFLVSYGAGAIGGFISVLQRMAGEKFTIHYDLGKRSLYVLGSYRPVLGAVFGVFTYFVLASGLLQTKNPETHRDALFFYGSVAFVAGFSERFTKVLMKRVEGTVDLNPAGEQGGAAPEKAA